MMVGLVQNQDAYMQSVAAQRPFFFDHIRALAERAFDEAAAARSSTAHPAPEATPDGVGEEEDGEGVR